MPMSLLEITGALAPVGHCGGGGAQPLVGRDTVIELSWFVPLLEPEPFAQEPISLTRSSTEFTPAGSVNVPVNANPFDDLNWPLPLAAPGSPPRRSTE